MNQKLKVLKAQGISIKEAFKINHKKTTYAEVASNFELQFLKSELDNKKQKREDAKAGEQAMYEINERARKNRNYKTWSLESSLGCAGVKVDSN